MRTDYKGKQQYGKRAAAGAVWVVFSMGVGKSASLASQFVLGWMLSREDFGVYAIAIAFSTVAMMLMNGGTERILIQQGSRFTELVPSVLWLALGFNLLSALGLIALAPALARLYESPEIKYLCWIIAISFPLATHIVVYRARLSIDLRFSDLARVGAMSSLVQHGSMIVFAIAGFGVYSFVLPLLVVRFYEWYAYRKNAGIKAQWRWTGLRYCRPLFQDSKWVLIGAVGAAFALQGDYLVIGLLESKDLVGSYFFGFQLVVSAAWLFARGIQMVMLPSFTQFVDDAQRLQQAYMKVLRVLAILLMPLGIIISILAEPLLIFLWGDKWESAVIVVQLLALGFPSWAFVQLSFAVYEAKGLWPLKATMHYIDAAGVMLTAFVGAQLGGLLAIATCIMAYRAVIALVNLLVAGRILMVGTSTILNGILWPILLALFCGGIAYFWVYNTYQVTSPYWSALIAVSVFIVAFLFLGVVLMKGRLKEIYTALRSTAG